MGHIYNEFNDLVGNTPLLNAKRFSKDFKANFYTKLEYLNPAGSVKDRIAKGIILDGLKKGSIKSNSTIIDTNNATTELFLTDGEMTTLISEVFD